MTFKQIVRYLIKEEFSFPRVSNSNQSLYSTSSHGIFDETNNILDYYKVEEYNEGLFFVIEFIPKREYSDEFEYYKVKTKDEEIFNLSKKNITKKIVTKINNRLV